MTAVVKQDDMARAGNIDWLFECPGCGYDHWFRTDGNPPKWTWNNDTSNPTVSPSLLVRAQYRCHSFIKNGQIEFLSDCDHSLAGKTVPLKPYEDMK